MTFVKSEYLFIAAVILIILSASRMSQIGNALGKFVYSFKKAKDGAGYVDGKTVSMRSGSSEVVDAEIVDEKKTRQS